MDSSGLHTQRLDHLGIVAGICNQIGLIEQIDAEIGPNKRKVSVGQAVQAMVLNGLGFVSGRLYLSPEFFENKAVALLRYFQLLITFSRHYAASVSHALLLRVRQ